MPIPTRSKSVKTTNPRANNPGDVNASKNPPVSASAITLRDGNLEQVPRLARSTQSRQTPTTAGLSHGRSTQSISSVAERLPGQIGRAERSTAPSSQIPGSTVGHARTQSASLRKVLPIDRVNPQPGRQQPATLHARANSESLRPPSKIRPPFNNYKQHFSPRKPSTPGTSSANTEQPDAIPDEDLATSNLRQELLQISCVYQNSPQTLVSFERSVGIKANSIIADLKHDQDAVDSMCAERQAVINADALHRWLYKDTETADVDKLHSLSFSVSELANMTSPRGKFSLCMQEFDLWLEEAQAMVANGQFQDHSQQIQPISRSWSHCTTDLRSRLEVCQYKLSELIDDDSPDDATLSHIIRRHIDLASALHVSLDESASIVDAILARQQVQVAGRIANLMAINAQAAEIQRTRRAVWEGT